MQKFHKNRAAAVRRHQKTLDKAKQLYDRADELLAKLVKPFTQTCKYCGASKLKPEAEILLNESGTEFAQLRDNFATRETQWGHGSVRPYSMKVAKR